LPSSNAGVLTATGPAGATFVSASAGGTNTNGTVQWNVGSGNSGAAQHYTFTATIGAAPAAGTVLQPTTQLVDGTTSLARAGLLTEVRTTVPLKLSVVANPDPAAAGGLVYYAYKFTNTSSTPLTNIVLTEQTQNAASTFISETTGGGACNGAGACGPG